MPLRSAAPANISPMSDSTERTIFLLRHGETQWSRSGQHTGRTDLPLTEAGRAAARGLRPALSGQDFALVLCSPLLRARQTCELAGLIDRARFDDDLREWDYGRYEGLTTPQIHEERPGWNVFDDGCPGGESPAEVAARTDRVIARIGRRDPQSGGAIGGNVAIFAHGHLLRVLASRWLELPARFGGHLLLDTGTLCTLGHYHGQTPALRTWNAPPGK